MCREKELARKYLSAEKLKEKIVTARSSGSGVGGPPIPPPLPGTAGAAVDDAAVDDVAVDDVAVDDAAVDDAAVDDAAVDDAADKLENDRVLGGSKRTGVRGGLSTLDLDTMGVPDLIAATSQAHEEMMGLVRAHDQVVKCRDMDAFVKAMAADDGTDIPTAQHKISTNSCRMFTGEKDGRIYMLDGAPGQDHDLVHEVVHLLSAPQGVTRIHTQFGALLNEGFTEFFTVRMCEEQGVDVYPAYENALGFVSDCLAKHISVSELYKAYMQNQGIDSMVDHMCDQWWKSRDKISISTWVPPEDPDARHALLVARLKDRDWVTPVKKNFWKWLTRS